MGRKSTIKKIRLAILYSISGLAGFVALFFAAEFLLSRIPAHRGLPSIDSPETIHMYVLSNGVHTDLVFPVKSATMDWHTVFPYEHTIGGDSSKGLIAIGWGDREFYLNTPEWEDLSLRTALRAGLGIGGTVLHVTYYRELIEDEQCYRISIGQEQYRQLVDYVRKSLDTDQEGNAIYVETTAQYGPNDAFYEALGSYSLFYSCNTWTNSGLKSAKLPSAIWTVFDKGILRQY